MTINEKIKFIREKHHLKQSEFGVIIGAAQKVVSNWESGKNEPSLQSIIQIIEKFNISPAWLLKNTYETDMQDDTDELYFSAKSLAIDSSQQTELKQLLSSFIAIHSTLADTMEKLKTIKGKEAISRLSEAWSGKGERMLIVLDYFLTHLQQSNIPLGNSIKTDFISALQEFKTPHRFYTIKEKDKNHLIEWIQTNLTDVEIFDIVSSTANMQAVIECAKNELTIFNKYL